uniref:MAC-inhibitory protein n=2 Tax=Neogobius melanostomus TaxID=47308 RepID=A0A8C6S983_9GOBI
MFQVKMKLRLVLAVALLYALMPTGDSIKCYSCEKISGSCDQTKVCPLDDACLTLKAQGDTYRSCVKYNKCDFNSLSFVYPTLSSFSFSCCNSDLCNSAPAASASLLIGLLCSLLAVWWTAP